MNSLALTTLFFFFTAYKTNPTEASFRTFLTEQSFRHHLSRLDDTDAQDESELARSGTTVRPDARTRRGLSSSLKHRSINDSSPFAFANRASVSLRTPRHVYRSFGILSIAAVVPPHSSHRSPTSTTRRANDAINAREDNAEGANGTCVPMIPDSWFIGAFGMWFCAANLDLTWNDVGFSLKDVADESATGVLEIKSLDRVEEGTRA